MTKTGSDYLKTRAREIRKTTGRRYPDVLAEVRRAPHPAPRQHSKELVLVCTGLAHPIDGGRCARPAGHRNLDGGWGMCSPHPHYPSLIWQGYITAEHDARRAQHDTWLTSLTPEERAEYEAESQAAHDAEMADEAREPYDPYDDKLEELRLDALDEHHRHAEADEYEDDYEDDEEPWW